MNIFGRPQPPPTPPPEPQPLPPAARSSAVINAELTKERDSVGTLASRLADARADLERAKEAHNLMIHDYGIGERSELPSRH